MPTYVYRCMACGQDSEVEQRMTDAPKRKCKACGRHKLERQIQPTPTHFKGSGFYETDYKKKHD